MNIKELQKDIYNIMKKYASDNEFTLDTNFSTRKLTEELGEFMQESLILEKKSRKEKYIDGEISKNAVARELSDIIGIALLNAELYNIDIEKAFEDKWMKYKK